MKKAAFLFGIYALAITPVVALAQFGPLDTFAGTLVDFINSVLIPLIFAIALLVFIWGMFTYFILGGGDEGKREQGKSLMFWAIIGFVLMIIIFAIVNLLAEGLLSGIGEDNTSIEKLPTANPVGG